MKFWKHSLAAAFVFIGISSTVLYTACEQDACTQLVCKNGGTCADGFCRCQTGYEGAECGTKTANRFIGQYYGATTCGLAPNVVDTATIFLQADPNLVCIVRTSNIHDTLCGMANGNYITIPDRTLGNNKRIANAMLGRTTLLSGASTYKLTVFEQTVTDVNNNLSGTCSFSGAKP